MIIDGNAMNIVFDLHLQQRMSRKKEVKEAKNQNTPFRFGFGTPKNPCIQNIPKFINLRFSDSGNQLFTYKKQTIEANVMKLDISNSEF